MLPAFFVLAAMKFLGMPFWTALFLGLAIALIVLGLLFKKLIVEPILPHGGITLIIATMAWASC